MKHRVFRYLVENGYRAFGFETPWVQAEMAKDYVATCNGDVEDALDSLFTVWNCTEVAALLDWMCQWNQQNSDDPVHFYGFDIQCHGDLNTAPLIAFLKRLEHESVRAMIEGILLCDGAETSYYPDAPYPHPLSEQVLVTLVD